MKRRQFLTTLPATTCVLTASASTAFEPLDLPAAKAEAPEKETTCARIFRLWNIERERLNSLDPDTVTELEYESIANHFDVLGAAMLPVMAVTAEDFILKIIVLSDYGSCGLPLRSDWPELWKEAEGLGIGGR